MVALSKMSHHQADIEARVAAKAAGDGDSGHLAKCPLSCDYRDDISVAKTSLAQRDRGMC